VPRLEPGDLVHQYELRQVLDWWACAAAAIGICGYIAVRYEPLTYTIALLPLEGVIGSAVLILLVLEATAAPPAACWSASSW